MLTSHAILRHKFDNYDIETLQKEEKYYLKVLKMMQDNGDGREGAFSIQNIARMSLIYNKFPGEWHGPGSISNVMKELNKVYTPVENFEIVHFPDGMIYYDKIQKVAEQTQRNYLIELMKKQDMNDDRIAKL